MSRPKVEKDLKVDDLLAHIERLTEMRLFLTKDAEMSPRARAQRIYEVNQELRRIEALLAEFEIG